MERTESTEVRHRHTRSRAWRWLRRGVAAVVLLALVAWLAVPVAVRRLGESQGTQALGRALRIGDAHFNPLTLSLRLDDVALAGPGPGTPDTATLAHLELAIGWRSLWKRAPVLTEVRLDAPALRVARTAPGHFDVDDILERLARRPAAPASDEPARFALYNIRIEGGSAVFDDRPVHRTHRLEGLQLGVPFLSNLPRDVEIEVAPRLQFVLDGARYDSLAQATPFRTERAGEVQLHTGAVDVVPFLAYWPAALGWHPTQGRLKIDATLSFEAPAAGVPHVSIGGDLGVDDLAIVDAAGAPLLAWRRLAIGLDEVRPLERSIALKRVALDGLDARLDRDARGQLNVLRAMAAPPAPASSVPAPASAAAASSPASSAVAAAPPWSVKVQAIDLEGARIAWRDARVVPAVAYRVEDLQLTLADVRWPLPPGAAALPAAVASAASIAAPAASAAPSAVARATASSASATSARSDAIAVHLQGRWIADASPRPASAAAPATATKARATARKAGTAPRAASPASAPASASADGRFFVDGRLGSQRSDVDVTLEHLPLGPLRPYLAPYWALATDGELSARAQARWNGALQEVPPTIVVTQLAVDGLRLREAGRAAPVGAWRRASVAGLEVDLAGRRIELAGLDLAQPEFWLERDAAGALNVARWVPGGRDDGRAPPAPASSATASATPSAGAPGWQAHVGRATISGGRLHWRDAPAATPVALDVDALELSLADVGWPTRARATSPLKLAARVSTGNRTAATSAATAGRLDFDGRIGLAPVAWQGQLRAERVPLHLADPYLAGVSPLQLLHADLGWRGGVQGDVSEAGLRLRLKGDALLTDVHTRARYAQAQASEQGPSTASGDDLMSWQSLSASATQVTLAPGHAPVVAVGGVKLVDAYARLVVTEQGRLNLVDLAPPAAASAPAGATGASATAPASAPAGTTAAAAPDADAPDIRIGGIEWKNARFGYTDRFVRPNYTADLTGIDGTLGAFSSRKPDLAPLVLTGRVAGTGTLDIQGEVNPLARPRALDVRAKASDVELAPLSPYAVKYAGYAIERGKLSMDVHYRIAPDGRLEASNRLVLNQLTFGDHVDSPTATRLPVLFAISLLKDRNGVIDVNLPIAGSIDDPQFSVGGIVVRLIVNLLEKAITSPFALLAGGGESDLSQVPFVAGTARVGDGADKTLESVAKALQDRPALQLTITGLADEAQEHAALAAANLDAQLLGLRRTELLQAGQPDAGDAPLSPADRARLVKRLYADTKLPDKPRNAIGIARDVPQAEMESRLAAGLPLAADAARELAVRRAQVVRDALVARGLPNERMFVASPKVQAAGASEPQAWTPHAQLELSSR